VPPARYTYITGNEKNNTRNIFISIYLIDARRHCVEYKTDQVPNHYDDWQIPPTPYSSNWRFGKPAGDKRQREQQALCLTCIAKTLNCVFKMNVNVTLATAMQVVTRVELWKQRVHRWWGTTVSNYNEAANSQLSGWPHLSRKQSVAHDEPSPKIFPALAMAGVVTCGSDYFKLLKFNNKN